MFICRTSGLRKNEETTRKHLAHSESEFVMLGHFNIGRKWGFLIGIFLLPV